MQATPASTYAWLIEGSHRAASSAHFCARRPSPSELNALASVDRAVQSRASCCAFGVNIPTTSAPRSAASNASVW